MSEALAQKDEISQLLAEELRYYEERIDKLLALLDANLEEHAPPITNTARQKEALDFYNGFIKRRRYRPSVAQVARHFECSKSTAWKHLQALKRQGLLA